MTAKVVSSSPISRGGQAKGKSSAEGGLERASESLKRRPNSRSRRARDGHRFESPQLHQEVAANRPGFPAPTIPGLFSALARRLMVCGVYSAGTTDLGRPNAEISLRRRILGSRLRRWTGQRDREPFGLQSAFGGRP